MILKFERPVCYYRTLSVGMRYDAEPINIPSYVLKKLNEFQRNFHALVCRYKIMQIHIRLHKYDVVQIQRFEHFHQSTLFLCIELTANYPNVKLVKRNRIRSYTNILKINFANAHRSFLGYANLLLTFH